MGEGWESFKRSFTQTFGHDIPNAFRGRGQQQPPQYYQPQYPQVQQQPVYPQPAQPQYQPHPQYYAQPQVAPRTVAPQRVTVLSPNGEHESLLNASPNFWLDKATVSWLGEKAKDAVYRGVAQSETHEAQKNFAQQAIGVCNQAQMVLMKTFPPYLVQGPRGVYDANGGICYADKQGYLHVNKNAQLTPQQIDVFNANYNASYPGSAVKIASSGKSQSASYVVSSAVMQHMDDLREAGLAVDGRGVNTTQGLVIGDRDNFVSNAELNYAAQSTLPAVKVAKRITCR